MGTTAPPVRTVVGVVPPTRSALLFAWAVTAALFLVCFMAVLIMAMLALAPFSVHPDGANPLGVRWDAWASWAALGAAWFTAVVFVTAGGGSGVVWMWAELRVLDRGGREARWSRRALRPGLLAALVLAALAVRHDLLGLLAGALLAGLAVAWSVLAPDRRGGVERLLGIRDVAWGQVPAPDAAAAQT